MKSMKSILFTAIALFLCMGTNALAEECPDGSFPIFNEKTGQVLCFMPEGSQEADVQDMEVDDGFASKNSGGFELGLGIGYAFESGADIRVSMGYRFQGNDDGLGFGIYTDFSGRIPENAALDWAVMAKLHVQGHWLRVSIGVGAGIYTSWVYHEWDGGAFSLKLEMQIAYFLSEHFYLDLSVDAPIVFHTEDYIYDKNNPDMHRATNPHDFKDGSIVRTETWPAILLGIGYKF